jgi:hypothetical protein
MINFDTNNLIIVAYPPMAGGKFLINCLALSPDAVFQHKALAQQDLDNKLTSAGKMQILRDRLTSTNGSWRDLGMGCNLLFGVNTDRYREYNGDMSIFNFNNLTEIMSNSSKSFFIVAHDVAELTGILKIWKGARVIAFNNSLPFMQSRGGNDIANEYWQIIRGPHWPESAPKTIDQLMACPQFVIDEVNKLFPAVADVLVDCIERYDHDLTRTTFWDNNRYFSAEQTADGVEQLYGTFNLSGFNREYILEYHKLWIDKLNKLK